ncbi:SIR2 family NAD-dependent protein deacylase [Actinomycetota bacterium]
MRTDPTPDTAIVEALRAATKVTVMTGAGMSAESGVPTFRDAQTGLWEEFDAASLATPEAWDDDPEMVWPWYLWRARMVRDVQPNAGHLALAELARHKDVRLVTQNVDDLHERAGSEVLAHLHGSLLAFRCADCGAPAPEPELPAEPSERATPPQCAECGGYVRPGVVWFGEMLPFEEFEAAERAHEDADIVLVVGTSGLVYPAAGLPITSRGLGITVVEINPDETGLSDLVQHAWRTTAAAGLPLLVEAATRP